MADRRLFLLPCYCRFAALAKPRVNKVLFNCIGKSANELTIRQPDFDLST